LLTDNVGWRWIFYINVPVGAIALPAIWANLPHTRSGRRPRIDYLGGLFLSIAATAGLLVLAWSGEANGWAGSTTLALDALTALATAAFVWQELRHPEPIIPFHLFREREFLLGNLIVMSIGLAMQGAVPYLPTFLQVAQNASSTASGLVTTPQSAGLLLTSIVGGQIISRTGKYKTITVAGIVLMLVSFALMLRLAPDTPTWHLGAIVVLLGLGGGLSMPTMSVVIQNAVSHAYLGVATSARQFFMQIGGVVGTALFGVLLTTTFQSEYQQNVPQPTRATISAETLRKFEDPTLSFDPVVYGRVSQEFLSQPDGATHLAAARQAQRTAISTAIHRIFAVSIGVIGAALLLALLLKERPLRRTLGPDGSTESESDGFPAAALPVH
jgi:predicted MFS family arabinose efflux permease